MMTTRESAKEKDLDLIRVHSSNTLSKKLITLVVEVSERLEKETEEKEKKRKKHETSVSFRNGMSTAANIDTRQTHTQNTQK